MKDQKAYLEFLSEHQNLIHKVCMIYTRSDEEHQDLFQEIVYQGWKSFHTFSGRSKISTWLYRVALYTALAGKKRKQPNLSEYLQEVKYQELEDQRKEDVKILYQLIEKLNKTDKALVFMYLDNLSYDEISEILGISVSNVGVRLNRIKKKLKKKWN